jgi:hypothetical protein
VKPYFQVRDLYFDIPRQAIPPPKGLLPLAYGFYRLPFCDVGKLRLPTVEVIYVPQFGSANSHLQVRLQVLPERRIGGACAWRKAVCIQFQNLSQIGALFCRVPLDCLGSSIGKATVV